MIRKSIQQLLTTLGEQPRNPSALSDNELRLEAERIAAGTELTWREALVLVGDRNDVDDRTLCRLSGRSSKTLDKARWRLREKKRNLDVHEKTVSELSE